MTDGLVLVNDVLSITTYCAPTKNDVPPLIPHLLLNSFVLITTLSELNPKIG